MISKKAIFIIPGFRQSTKSRAYVSLAKSLKKEGYSVKLVSIPWKNSTITDNTEFFLKEYRKVKIQKKYIIGFSYGAMIAFIASTKASSSGVVLCSLSPYFSEDTKSTNSKVLSKLTTQRYKDFSKLHAATLARKTKAKKVVMLYGTKEARSLIYRVRKTFSELELREKRLIPIRKTEHNIGHKNYLLTIHEATTSLTQPF